jgi:hypothetical protein
VLPHSYPDVHRNLSACSLGLQFEDIFAENNNLYQTPMDYVFYLSIASNVFSILGLAGVLHQQKDLLTAFFTYSAVQMVVVFHYFVDICADVSIRFPNQVALGSYEQAAAGVSLCLVQLTLVPSIMVVFSRSLFLTHPAEHHL